MTDPVIEHLFTARADILERLKSFIRIPSVSADAKYLPAMEQARSFLKTRLNEIGLRNIRDLEGRFGHPAVYADWLEAPGRPTLIIYGHYDVQPADPLNAWLSDPFLPEERNGRLYGRGASDVKGTTIIALETIAAFLKVEGRLPVNVKIFLEGEEEIGSPSLPSIVAENADLLAADAVLSADGGRAFPEHPTLYVGARGLATLEFSVRTATKDLHSGRYGGATRNALHEIAALIASLHDEYRAIAVPGFARDAAPVTDAMRAEAAMMPLDTRHFYGVFGGAECGDPARTPWERMTVYPTIEVNGVWGGYQGEGAKTVLPSEAHAKITMRLVDGQDPEHARQAVIDHLIACGKPGVQLSFSGGEGSARAFSLRPDHPMLVAAESVVEEIFGRAPIRVRSGGTVPFTGIFQDGLGIDTLMFGLATGDEDVHAPNEFFRLTSLDEGLRMWPAFLRKIAQVEVSRFRKLRPWFF